jgi:deoxyribonuclease V
MASSEASSSDGILQQPSTDESSEVQLQMQYQLKLAALAKSSGVQFESVRCIGGLDISFRDENSTSCCGCLVVLDYETLEIIYTAFEAATVTAPYRSGLLGFREVPVYRQLIKRMHHERPDLQVDVYMVDGFGTLHERGAGSATQLGVEAGVPTIGVAKTLMYIDGLMELRVKQAFLERDEPGSRSMQLIGMSGKVWGSAVITAKNPIYVSVGHLIDLGTCTKIVLHATERYRIPEPIRQADILSRQWLRDHPA